MLQRAASNAYSWWWASHIRTKQSKWLEQSLADMEDKVHNTLHIIDHDGDSFAKRAEMYYRRRPEIINFVEESFRAYRALAERYDHLSRDLQSANRTIAQVFPERVQFELDEEDENSSEASATPKPPNGVPRPGVPKVPKAPGKDFRSPSMVMSRRGQGQLKRSSSSARTVTIPSSGLSKADALEEIDRLQKGILGLQTEKEFVKSIYEHAIQKYWEMENQITEMQGRVCSLQDEFGIGTVIEDSEARSLMAATALKSCKETLYKLQEKQEQSAEDAKAEYARIKEAHDKLEALKEEFVSKYSEDQEESAEKPEAPEGTTSPDSSDFQHQVTSVEQEKQKEKQELETLRIMIKENLATSSNTNLTVMELAEKIDELVEKVVKLETAVTSQNALVKRLTSETDDLQAHIRELQKDKGNLIQSTDIMRKRLEELEEELRRVRSLNQNVKDQNTNLQTHFTEASCNIEHLTEKLQTVKLDEDLENAGLFKEVKEAPDAIAAKESKRLEERKLAARDKSKTAEVGSKEEGGKKDDHSVSGDSDKSPERTQHKDQNQDWSDREERDLDSEPQEEETEEEEDQPNWRQMYLNTLEDREKTLLEEYTSVLRNYKDVRRKLNDVEKRNKDSLFELTMQVRELVKANSLRDGEIQALRQQLNSQQPNREDSSSASSPAGYGYSPLGRQHESRSQLDGSPSSTISSLGLDQQPAIDSRRGQDESNVTTNVTNSPTKEKEKDIKVNHVGECSAVSTIEEKIRTDIDEMLEENLEFWLRFSTSIHQKQKYQTTIQDLKAEISRLKDKVKQEGSSKQKSQDSDLKPIYRHLREIHTELTLWLEQNAVLKDEVRGRFSSLSHIQDEITGASCGGREVEEVELNKYQAARFQGEVLNMKQENSKVEEELQTGLERVKALQIEVEHLLAKLDEELGMSTSKSKGPQMKHSPSRPRIPLRSFLFGVKLRKQKPSIFACVSPALQKQYSDLGVPRPL